MWNLVIPNFHAKKNREKEKKKKKEKKKEKKKWEIEKKSEKLRPGGFNHQTFVRWIHAGAHDYAFLEVFYRLVGRF